MIILAFDLETTGLDPVADRPIEVGAIVYSTGKKRCLESAGFLVKTDVPIPEKITGITGIDQAAVNHFGFSSPDALEHLLELADLADAFIGQNIIRFDKRFLENWCKRENRTMPNKLWIDTYTDLPGVEAKHLGYMAADAGFLNPFPHQALSDCQTVIKLFAMHDINTVIERAQSPTIVLLAHQAKNDNELAKARKFRWNSEYKIWWKTVKELDKATEMTGAPFNITVAPPEILIEKLWHD